MENLHQLLTRLGEQMKLAQQKIDELRQIIGALPLGTPQELPLITEALSPREKQVFDLLRQGLPLNKIAEELKISDKTVYVHRKNIEKKLNFPSFGQLLKNFPSHQEKI